jgi:hypothetical protein
VNSVYFNRDFALTVKEPSPSTNAVRIAGRRKSNQFPAGAEPTLRIQFKCEKTVGENIPNKADITVYNLSVDTRAKLQTKNTPVLLEAGYVGNISQIFSGLVTFVNHIRQGTDWLTQFQTLDGINAFQDARLSMSFTPGVDAKQIISTLIDKLPGIGRGNADAKLNAGSPRGLTSFSKGFSVQGKVTDALDKLIKAYGLAWSIQDGHVQLTDPAGSTDDSAVQLDSAHGMIESPSLGEDKLNQPVLKAKTLLNPALKAGRKVSIVSKNINGFFRVENVKHTGDSWGQEWYTEIEAIQL